MSPTKKELIIYLSGSIAKGNEEVDLKKGSFWTNDDKCKIQQAFNSQEIVFLNPAERSDDLADNRSVFGRDLLQVFLSDLVLVDCRVGKKGLGIGAEMMLAKFYNIPVITIITKNKKCNYYKEQATICEQKISSWIHPFVTELSDYVTNDLDDGINWFKQNQPQIKTKNHSHILKANQHYIKSQLSNDKEMHLLINKYPMLLHKIKKLEESDQLALLSL